MAIQIIIVGPGTIGGIPVQGFENIEIEAFGTTMTIDGPIFDVQFDDITVQFPETSIEIVSPRIVSQGVLS